MRSLGAYLPEKPAGRVLVVGAGKASARMAEAVEAVWGPCEGLVITRYGYGRPCEGIEIVEAAHPVPDEAGMRATARMLEMLQGLGPEDFVLALISGGASALMVAPVEGVSLAEKQAVNAALLASGAPIVAMNTLRKHLSRVKGGQLAAAAFPARMLALMISDIPGDDMAFIGSGPTVGDATTVGDARAVLARWKVAVPASVQAALARGSGVVAPGDPRLARRDQPDLRSTHGLAAGGGRVGAGRGLRGGDPRRRAGGRGAGSGRSAGGTGAGAAEGARRGRRRRWCCCRAGS